MPITTTSMALNVAVGFAVWMSDISLTAKIVITMILIGKCALFFYSAWMGDSESTRKIGTAICMLLNAALIVYGFVCAEYFIVVTTAIMLTMLVVWSFAVVFDFSFKTKEDK